MARRPNTSKAAQLIGEAVQSRRAPKGRSAFVDFGGEESFYDRIMREQMATRQRRMLFDPPAAPRRRKAPPAPIIIGDEAEGDGEALIEEAIEALTRSKQEKRKHTRWSQTGTLKTGDASGRVNMQADLKDLDYTYVTFAFGVTPPTNGKGFYAIATLTASVNGNPITRQISVANGSEISIPADAVSVQVQDSTPAALANIGQTYSVTVTVVPGTRAPGLPAVLHDVPSQVAPYVIPASNNTSISVPFGVGVIGAIVAAVGAQAAQTPDVQIQEVSSGGAITYELGLTKTDPVTVNLVPGTTTLTVINKDVANAVTFSVLWIVQG